MSTLKPEIAAVNTGCANLASVISAFERLGVATRVTVDPRVIEDSHLVVLPGVGAFGPAMNGLTARGLDAAIRLRVARSRPLLAICLGMQLLCESSEECPGVPGLGVVPGRVERFGRAARVPQMGWNVITPTAEPLCLRAGAAYFANSFRLPFIPPGWRGATAVHGGPFAAALERDNLLACQFHPELSGTYGLALLRAWLQRSIAANQASPTC